MHEYDHTAEDEAIRGYNESIGVAAKLGDNGTRDLLVSILKDEEGHIDLIEAHLDQIKQIGVQNYLMEQMD
jgi:bacterioferritin